MPLPSFQYQGSSLQFPLESQLSKGIFSFLSKLSLFHFVNEISVNYPDWRHQESTPFRPICFTDYLILFKSNREAFFQVSFTTTQVQISGYKIKAAQEGIPQNWKLLGSKNGGEWILIDHQTNNSSFQNKKIQNFAVQNSEYFDSFKLIFFPPNLEGESFHKINGFDIFGLIQGPNVSSFQSLISSQTNSLFSSSEFTFPFTGTRNLGLLAFLSSLPAEEFFDNFNFSGCPTLSVSSVFNLLCNDQSC
jgi:hypothetical protein